MESVSIHKCFQSLTQVINMIAIKARISAATNFVCDAKAPSAPPSDERKIPLNPAHALVQDPSVLTLSQPNIGNLQMTRIKNGPTKESDGIPNIGYRPLKKHTSAES